MEPKRSFEGVQISDRMFNASFDPCSEAVVKRMRARARVRERALNKWVGWARMQMQMQETDADNNHLTQWRLTSATALNGVSQ